MPTLISYDPQKLCDISAAELSTRSTEITRRVNYYDGKQTLFLVNPKTKTPTNENVIINVSKKVINQTVSFLFGDQPDIKYPDESISMMIEQLEDFNQDDIFYTNLGEEGATSGHVFVKLSPDNERGMIEWEIQCGELVTAFWSARSRKIVLGYMVKWKDGEIEYRQDIIKNSIIPGSETSPFWTIFDLQKNEKDTTWSITNTTPWNYEFSPMIDWQNLPDRRHFYGKSDLQSIDLNDSINFNASNIGRILKFHAHPKTVLTGGSTDDIKGTSVDGLWAISNPEAKVYNLEMSSDLGSSLNYLHELRSSFFSEQGAVDMDSFKDKLGQLTNFGLRVLFSDALAKNNTKQQLYEYGLKEIVYRSLALLNVKVNPQDIDIDFADPLPENMLEKVTMVTDEIGAGVLSMKTGSEELGHDWETEQANKQAEKQSASGELGTLLAEAMRKQNTVQDENAITDATNA
jgi:hypothetical protein